MVMLLASINYGLSLGFALHLPDRRVAWISIHHAFRNLVDLSISPGRSDAVFCGGAVPLAWYCTTRPAPPRLGLKIWPTGVPNGGAPSISPEASAAPPWPSPPTFAAGCGSPPHPRNPSPAGAGPGLEPVPARPAMPRSLPAPEADAPCPRRRSPPRAGRTVTAGATTSLGCAITSADSPRHVAWKTVARAAPAHQRNSIGAGSQAAWLDWQHLPPAMGWKPACRARPLGDGRRRRRRRFRPAPARHQPGALPRPRPPPCLPGRAGAFYGPPCWRPEGSP